MLGLGLKANIFGLGLKVHGLGLAARWFGLGWVALANLGLGLELETLALLCDIWLFFNGCL